MRADKFFADKFESRTKAAEAIEKGLVLINGKRIRPKDEVQDTDVISYVEPDEYFVSNGGYKLNAAIKAFGFDCSEKTFVDIGASTGGFTDCLLQYNAKKVYAVDVGESLLHESLKNDPRIIRIENTNARYLTRDSFAEDIDGIVADVSFISLRLIFPVIAQILSKNGDAFVLIKPQFECEKKNIGKSGIVRHDAHAKIVAKVCEYAVESSLFPFNIVHAPIRKGKNIEYVLHVKSTQTGRKTTEELVQYVQKIIKSSGDNGEEL